MAFQCKTWAREIMSGTWSVQTVTPQSWSKCMEVLWMRLDRVAPVTSLLRDTLPLGLAGWGSESKAGGKASDWHCWGSKIMPKDKDTGVQDQHVLWNTNLWSELRFPELHFAPQLSMIKAPGSVRELTSASGRFHQDSLWTTLDATRSTWWFPRHTNLPY